jgi:phenylacetate-CoA ligase
VLNEMHARKYWRTGLRPGNIVLQALSLSMFTGGLPLSDGLQAMGLCVVPVGIEGGTKRVLDFILLTRPDVIIATPPLANISSSRPPDSPAGMPETWEFAGFIVPASPAPVFRP